MLLTNAGVNVPALSASPLRFALFDGVAHDGALNGFMPEYRPSVLAAASMATTPAASAALLVAVSTCATFQLAVVNSIDVGVIVTEALVLRIGIVTFAVGALFSTTVARLPETAVVSRTVIPGAAHV